MRQQLPTHRPLNRVRPTPLLMLWTWMGLTLGLSHLMLSTLEAQAADLIIPAEQLAAPAAQAAPAAPVAPKPVAPAVPKPIIRSAPKPVVRSTPIIQSAPVQRQVQKPVTPAPAAGTAQPQKAKPTASGIIRPAPAKPIAAPSTAASSTPSPQVKGNNPLIDASRNYDLGATQPYVKPSRVVVSERASGCQAVVSGRSLASSICGGSATPPARQVRVSPARAVAAQGQAAPLNLRYAASQPQRGVTANLPGGLTPATAPTFAAKPYSHQPYKAKSYQGANPLKWLLSDGKQMIFPLSIPAQISSAFGLRVHPLSGQQKFHAGTDIAAPMGTPVVAAYDGDVAVADYLGGYGLSVLLHHSGGEHATRYAHLSEIFVQPGQTIEQGTVIGLVGSTGYSTGPHLHFEAMKRTAQGYAMVDPGIQLEVALSVLVDAIQVAQLPPSQPSQTDEGFKLPAPQLPQLQARVPDVWTSPLDYRLTE
jgi:murein DD-endopeptidase MepM/ murein hydrolase activator NlpD